MFLESCLKMFKLSIQRQETAASNFEFKNYKTERMFFDRSFS